MADTGQFMVIYGCLKMLGKQQYIPWLSLSSCSLYLNFTIKTCGLR